MIFATRTLAAVAAFIAAAASPAAAQPSRDSVRTGTMSVIDDNCRNYRVALAFPRSEHDKIKAAAKAEGAAGPYPEIAKQFAQDTKVVGLPGACQAAFKKARENGANETMLQPEKDFLTQQTVILYQTARLRTVQDLCKLLVVDARAMAADLEKHGLDAKESRVKKSLKQIAYDEYRRYKNNPSPFCLDMYGKWSASGMLKTRQ
jgi:hypothetical protein